MIDSNTRQANRTTTPKQWKTKTRIAVVFLTVLLGTTLMAGCSSAPTPIILIVEEGKVVQAHPRVVSQEIAHRSKAEPCARNTVARDDHGSSQRADSNE